MEKGKYELEDCRRVMQNLVKLVASQKLTGGMVEMGMICDLVGRCLDRSEEEDEADEKVRGFFEEMSKEEAVEFFTGAKPNPITWKQEIGKNKTRMKKRGKKEEKTQLVSKLNQG